jgi:hypothetical protein
MRTLLVDLLLAIPAVVSLAAGLMKLRYPREFRAAMISWRVVPATALVPISVALPTLEIAIALLAFASLDVAGLRVPAAAALVALFAAFVAGQVFIRWRTPAASCGCLGRKADRLGRATLARSIVLAALAVVALALV